MIEYRQDMNCEHYEDVSKPESEIFDWATT